MNYELRIMKFRTKKLSSFIIHHSSFFPILTSCILLLAYSLSYAVDIRSIAVTDSLGTPRTSFSSSERITLKVEVYNASICDKIEFTFIVYDPAGLKVLEHRGNSIPGTVGVGGSSVSDVYISRFYKTPGSYVYEVRASEIKGGVAVDTKSQRTSFFVFSPVLTLIYPSNSARDLADSPLIFRWAGSGATKYRLSVDDNIAFYNRIYAAETSETSLTYPQNPTDIRQRLKGGIVYYWKVEGLDAFGNIIAQTQLPFTFTIKDTASSQITRDIGITAITIEPFDAENINLKVELKNLGSRAETDIGVSLFISGILQQTLRVASITAGQTAIQEFTVKKPQSEKFLVTAAHNFVDDTSANNILTLTITMPSEVFVSKGKIIGKIMAADDKKAKDEGIADALIVYTGPVRGELRSAKNGQYQLDDLPLGNYRISVSHPEFESSEVAVELTKNRAYPQVDFRLNRKPPAAAVTVSEFGAAIRSYLSERVLNQLKGYELLSIDGASSEEYAAILEGLKTGAIKIDNAVVE